MARNIAKYEWEKEEGSNLLDLSESCPQVKFYERRRGFIPSGGLKFLPIPHACERMNKILPRQRYLFRLDPRTNALSIAKLLNSVFNVFSIHVVIHL